MNFNYEIFLREEFISIYFEDESTIDIDIQDFWDFIKSRELNHYTLDYFNPQEADGHSQELGKYSYDEYFSIPYQNIHADLVKYFKFNNINKYF